MPSKKILGRVEKLLSSVPSRSQVCTFINELDALKIITSFQADQLVDILTADKCNIRPVLRMIRNIILKKESQSKC